MRIATWNVNSVKQRVPRLLPWLDERRPDVVCLQETKLTDDAFATLLNDELEARGYQVATHGEAQWNGVAILSRVGLDDVVVGRKRLFQADVIGEDRYAELGLGGKQLSREEAIATLVANPILIERPIVVAGDRAVVARPPERVAEVL